MEWCTSWNGFDPADYTASHWRPAPRAGTQSWRRAVVAPDTHTRSKKRKIPNNIFIRIKFRVVFDVFGSRARCATMNAEEKKTAKKNKNFSFSILLNIYYDYELNYSQRPGTVVAWCSFVRACFLRYCRTGRTFLPRTSYTERIAHIIPVARCPLSNEACARAACDIMREHRRHRAHRHYREMI